MRISTFILGTFYPGHSEENLQALFHYEENFLAVWAMELLCLKIKKPETFGVVGKGGADIDLWFLGSGEAALLPPPYMDAGYCRWDLPLNCMHVTTEAANSPALLGKVQN